jgi:hypothetical protein
VLLNLCFSVQCFMDHFLSFGIFFYYCVYFFDLRATGFPFSVCRIFKQYLPDILSFKKNDIHTSSIPKINTYLSMSRNFLFFSGKIFLYFERREQYNRYLHFYSHHWVDTSAGGLLVSYRIFRQIVSALTWFVKYCIFLIELVSSYIL